MHAADDAAGILARAWRWFDTGDRDAAIGAARQAREADPALAGAHAALGYFLLEAGVLDEAQAVLEAALDQAPGHAPLHWYRGLLLQRLGRLDAAVDVLRRACLLDAGLDEAAFVLAWLLHDQGELQEAAAWCSHALAIRRTPARLLQAGWLQQQQGDLRPAVDAYREALQGLPLEAPEFVRACVHLVQCLRAQGELDAAHAVLGPAQQAHPADPDLLLELAWLLRAQGDRGAALGVARELVQANPGSADAWFLLGLLQEEEGLPREADASYAQAHQRAPGNVQALVRRARVLRELGQQDGPRWLLSLARDQAPGDPATADLMAQLMLDAGETAPARRQLVLHLRSAPEAPDRWRLLAAAHVQAGRPRAARRALMRALRQAPGNVEALRSAGWLGLELGDVPAAVDAVRRLLAAVPGDTVAQLQAAFVFAAAGMLNEAQAWAEQAVAHAPRQPEAWRALAEVRYHQGRLDEAEHAIRESLRLAPGRLHSLRQLGWIHLAARRPGQAQLAFLRALELAPEDDQLAVELAEARRRSGEADAARRAAEALLVRRGRWAPALLLQARVLRDADDPASLDAAVAAVQSLALAESGSQAEALRLLLELDALGSAQAGQALALAPAQRLHRASREAIAQVSHTRGPRLLAALAQGARRRFPGDPWFQSASLFASSLSEGSTAEALARDSRDSFRAWKISSGLSRLDWNSRPDRARRRPRIAYVAGQLHEPLLRRVLAAHDPQAADVFLHATQPMTGLPAHVRMQTLVPQALAAACAANGVDLVIDAGGLHPFEGQDEVLRAYARRLAPVQAGWLGSWGTSGGLFDVLLTDETAVPRSQERHYEEEVVRLEGGQWCWDPPLAAPPLTAPPLLAMGVPTFGVVARSLRLQAGCLDAFARVLAATPGAMLRCIGEIADDPVLQREVLAALAAHGVEPTRAGFDSPRPYEDFLAWCGGVDVVLDTFPGSGGLSLLAPLWMGVPVVTLAGGWAGARQGASLLQALDLPGCIAQDADAFVRIARQLVRDEQALEHLRSGLRERVRLSPLLDGRRVAAQIEALAARGSAATESGQGTGPPDAKTQVRGHADRALDAWLRVPRTIALPEPQEGPPVVSVVVVLFNQAGLVRRTLQALADQRGVEFETIIVDNASSDRTPELLDRVTGARIMRNAGNTGFLRAANQGAALARGRILALLNSDAFLQEGALRATVDAFDADGSIGALGGRIVLTAGGLQEAGNVIFRDGSAGGIGRGEDPWSPAARVARSTDYVSGVFLATPLALWRRLGGFDDAYAPAYYEDTDYCLRVWQAGLRCVVEPAVLVEHVEWGSATGDSATQLMQRNRAVFLRRHGQWLSGQPRPMSLRLDADPWRSPQDRPRRRPRVLVIDNEVPLAVRGGGLPRARLMLQELAGWPVTFYPLWTVDDTWATVQASVPASVEVMLGQGLGGLEDFLARRRGVYDVLVVSRPPNLAALAPLRERRAELFAGMRLVYDAEALFALREIAMAGVRGRPFTRDGAQAHVAAEVALARGASDVIVVSDRDAAHFRRAGMRTHVLAHSIAVRRGAPGVAGRAGLLFVGALHPDTPNEDGLLWFVREVLPQLAQRGLRPVLNVVGVCRSDRVAALAGDTIRVLGPQDRLEPHYDAARVFVAPVRFAGGVPAKVIEAAAHGIPVVASALLVRQLQWREGLDVQGARDAGGFAAGIARLLSDDGLWRRQQEAAWDQCARRYDPRVFGDAWRRILDPDRP